MGCAEQCSTVSSFLGIIACSSPLLLSANIALLDRVSRQLLQTQPVCAVSGRGTAFLRGILQLSYSIVVEEDCLELDSFA